MSCTLTLKGILKRLCNRRRKADGNPKDPTLVDGPCAGNFWGVCGTNAPGDPGDPSAPRNAREAASKADGLLVDPRSYIASPQALAEGKAGRNHSTEHETVMRTERGALVLRGLQAAHPQVVNKFQLAKRIGRIRSRSRWPLELEGLRSPRRPAVWPRSGRLRLQFSTADGHLVLQFNSTAVRRSRPQPLIGASAKDKGEKLSVLSMFFPLPSGPVSIHHPNLGAAIYWQCRLQVYFKLSNTVQHGAGRQSISPSRTVAFQTFNVQPPIHNRKHGLPDSWIGSLDLLPRLLTYTPLAFHAFFFKPMPWSIYVCIRDSSNAPIPNVSHFDAVSKRRQSVAKAFLIYILSTAP
ncbi:hypothetical protein C8R43DRAFT_954704 [Mycena crocata]|nr:hypothetical protein C8R43DRAFT_954704 [Mycena crocata]